jgi:hypothetical protein
VIRYLEQLEHDLVCAIEQPSPARRRLPRPRPQFLAVAAAVVLAIVVVHAIARHERVDERSVEPAPTASATPLPAGTPLRLVVGLDRSGPQEWTGSGRGPGGGGTLTITGIVDLSRRTCCGTPQVPSSFTRNVIRFRWVSALGSVKGCIMNSIYRRPHGRWIWDGTGRITRATGQLRRYGGHGAGIAGRTPLSRPGTARIILDVDKGPPEPCR